MVKFRLTLIGMIVVLTAYVLTGRTASAVECEEEDAIKRFGGAVTDHKILIPDEKDKDKEVVDGKTVSFLNSTIRDADFGTIKEALEKIPDLKKLDLRSTRVTGEGLGVFGDLARLTELDLSGTLVTDATISSLCHWIRLEKLSLNYTLVTPAGMARLACLPKLTTLELAGIRIPCSGLVGLERLKTLNALTLAAARVPKSGLVNLCDFGTLTFLDVSGINLATAEKVQILMGLRNLHQLNVANTGIRDDDLAKLGIWDNLTELIFSDNKEITDVGLKHLEGLVKLKRLGLSGIGQKDQTHGVTTTQLGSLLAKMNRLERLDVSNTTTTFDLDPTKLPKLEWLNLSKTGISNKELIKTVAQLTALTQLQLFGTVVTDKGLESLCNLAGLKEIGVDGKATDAGVKRLNALRADLFDPKKHVWSAASRSPIPIISNTKTIPPNNLGLK
jgi:Leucine-rich repeat (LRR) protein